MEKVLAEILDNTRKTKNYMKWQLIITVGFGDNSAYCNFGYYTVYAKNTWFSLWLSRS
jgi:hypothetical protein